MRQSYAPIELAAARQIVYWPEYSIHSPEQVESLLQDLLKAREVFRDLRDKSINEHFEEDLLHPIEAAAKCRRAVFARLDY
jgi:hypothetical protein